jgi:GntR family transcriptional regulator/MocR family aminotransferase
VDADGVDVAAGALRCPTARLAYVTPSHQYPLGVTMSLGRRLALLDWARQAQAWVLEDDYDSEYRYIGRPLASLQGLDEDRRVLYTGSFSKVLFPALRLGYLVVPDDLVDAFTQARAIAGRGSPLLEQAVVARFLADGHFGRHIRQMRTLYAERQGVLVREAQRHLAGALEVRPVETGLHVVGRLPATCDDQQASAAALRQGVYAAPLSAYALEPLPLQGLVLGYAGCTEQQIREGVARLAGALAGAPGR